MAQVGWLVLSTEERAQWRAQDLPGPVGEVVGEGAL